MYDGIARGLLLRFCHDAVGCWAGLFWLQSRRGGVQVEVEGRRDDQ